MPAWSIRPEEHEDEDQLRTRLCGDGTKKNSTKIGQTSWKQINGHSHSPKHDCVSWQNADNPGQSQDAHDGDDLLILPEGEFEEIAVASVNPVRNSRLAYTQIVNWTDHPITIKAGQRFGTGFVASVQKIQEETGQG